MRTRARILATTIALGAFSASSVANAQTGSLNVNGQANLWYAGLGAPAGDGLLPPSFTFAAGNGKILTFASITGFVNCCSSTPGTSPDGDATTQGISAFGGISGILMPRQLPLVGVFLDGSGQPAIAPAGLDFTTGLGVDFLSVSPLLGQSFFIGNGFTSGNVQQQFFVPSGATMLYLGIPDACGFNGTPNNCYSDNTGAFDAEFEISGAIDSNVTPEPASVVLLATGLLGMGAVARRKRK